MSGRTDSDSAANRAMDAYARGQCHAFEELYVQLAPRLLAFLISTLRDRQRAEDLVQETMLSMHRARGAFIRGADVIPWAFSIARRLSIDRSRRQKIEQAALNGHTHLAWIAEGTGPDDWIFAKELAERLEAAVESLPQPQREAFELVRRHGLSHAQAAQVLGITVTAVKLRVFRAYEYLRAKLRT